MPDEVLAEKVRKLEVSLAVLEVKVQTDMAEVAELRLEISELRANLLGPTSPFRLVLHEVSELRRTVDGHTTTLAEHTAILASHSAVLAEHTATLADHTVQLASIKTLLVRVATKLDVPVNEG